MPRLRRRQRVRPISRIRRRLKKETDVTLSSVSGGPFSVSWGESGPPTLLGVRVRVLTLGLRPVRVADRGLGAYPNMG